MTILHTRNCIFFFFLIILTSGACYPCLTFKTATCTRTLPAGTDGCSCAHVSNGVEGPVVDDLGIVLLLGPFITINDQVHVREVYVQGVVMPLVVANLKSLMDN